MAHLLVGTEIYQGQDSFRIETPACTLLYHKEGCGFAALIDADGNDWISYRPEGGEYGHFRGIPNMGRDVFGHPGYALGARSELETLAPDHVRIVSTSADDAWRSRWDIYPRYATQTVEAVAAPYWWLYEGTPGGRFRPDINYRIMPDGQRQPCSRKEYRPAASARWVGFGDPECGRVLLVCAHGDEETVDNYWPMGGEGGMTVFGFGRDDLSGARAHLTAAPARFSFSLVESEDHAVLEDRFLKIQAQISDGP